MIYYSNQERCMTSVFGLARIEKILRCKLNIFLVDSSLSKLKLFYLLDYYLFHILIEREY